MSGYACCSHCVPSDPWHPEDTPPLIAPAPTPKEQDQ